MEEDIYIWVDNLIAKEKAEIKDAKKTWWTSKKEKRQNGLFLYND